MADGTEQSFADALLSAIGAPVNATTEMMVYAWGACESSWSTPAGANNYLNMKDTSGAWMSFGDPSSAGSAAGQRLVGPGYTAYNYDQIVNALQQADTGAFANAVGSSSWGTNGSCIAGVLGSGPSTATSPGTAPSSTSPGTATTTQAQQQTQTDPMLAYMTLLTTKGPGFMNLSETYPLAIQGGWIQEQSVGDWIWHQISSLWNPSSTPPQSVGESVVGGAVHGGQAVVSGLSNTEKALGAIASVFQWIFSPINLLRVGEVILGTLCLAVGTVLFLGLLFPNLSRTLSGAAGAMGSVMSPAMALRGMVA